MKKLHAILLASGLLFVMACMVESSIKPLPGNGISASKDSSIYAIAGEFRTVAANLLWMKADAYHHEFLEHNKDWTANKELLGLLKMIVDFDPHFEEAYASGAYMYLQGYHNPKAALKFLREGLTNNPRSWDLNRLAAMLYAIEFKDYKKSLLYARKSFAYSRDPFNKKLAARLIITLQKKTTENHQTTHLVPSE